MIKKDIKTLSEFKNPTSEPRWRLHLDDGSHIDVTGTAERNATLARLLRDGRITAQGVNGIHNLRIQSLRGVENITLNMTINRTEEVEEVREKSSTWKMFKEDVGGWSWPSFFTRMGLSSVAALLMIIMQYITSGPIKIDNEVVPFVKVLLFMMGITWTMSTLAWSLWKSWIILPYITCWIKMILFAVVFILCHFTVGVISEGVEDKIMGFIAKHLMTDKEIKILTNVLS